MQMTMMIALIPVLGLKLSKPCIPADVIVTPAASEIAPSDEEPTNVTASFMSLAKRAPRMNERSRAIAAAIQPML